MGNRYRGIAQLVEQWSPKPRAEGSSPSAPAIVGASDRKLAPIFIYKKQAALAPLSTVCMASPLSGFFADGWPTVPFTAKTGAIDAPVF